MSDKRYCIHCGKEIEANVSKCPHCQKEVTDKENLFLDYLKDHTKDTLKSEAEDKVFEIIKNWLLSHLYGFVVTLLLVSAVVTGVQRITSADSTPTIVQRPQSAAQIQTVDDISTLTTNVTPLYPVLSYDFETQVEVMLANTNLWFDTYDTAMGVYHFISDYDQNGYLEINTGRTLGSGSFTTLFSYEVNPEMTGLNPVNFDVFSEDNAPESFVILDADATYSDGVRNGYYQPETGVYTYLMSDYVRSGVAYNESILYAVTMQNGVVNAETLGSNSIVIDQNGNENITHTLNNQQYDSLESYYAAVEQMYESYVPFEFYYPWFYAYEVFDIRTQLYELASAYYLRFADSYEVPAVKPVEYSTFEEYMEHHELLDGTTVPATVIPGEHYISDYGASGVLSAFAYQLNNQEYTCIFTLENNAFNVALYDSSFEKVDQKTIFPPQEMYLDIMNITLFENDGRLFFEYFSGADLIASGISENMFELTITEDQINVTQNQTLTYSGSAFDDEFRQVFDNAVSSLGLKAERGPYWTLIEQNPQAEVIFQVTRSHYDNYPGAQYNSFATEEFGSTTFTDNYTDHRSLN